MRRTLVASAFFALLLAAWQFFATTGGPGRAALLPPPTDVALYLWRATADGSLAEATLVTARRLALGYAAGVALGLPLGLLTARFRTCADTLGVVALGPRRCRASAGRP